MKKIILLICASLLFAGCATTTTTGTGSGSATDRLQASNNDTPMILAGKSLLAVKSTIVTAAKATAGLCRTGLIKPADCALASDTYELSKPAYDTAVNSYLLMVSGGDPAAFDAALQQLQTLSIALNKLSGGAK